MKKIALLTLMVLIVACMFINASVTFAGKPPAASPTPSGNPTPKPSPSSNPITIFGVWDAGNHYCDWSLVRDMTEFDQANHWLIDRGDGSGLPSVNLVVLSFVNPLKLLNKTTDAGDVNGIPVGMTQAVVDYYKSHNIRVMLSIGGITYTADWDTALSTNPAQLALNAAEVAKAMGVGIEIDYEQNTNPNVNALQTFISTYRSQLPYDATGSNPAARLTIDLATGDRWLIDLCRYATTYWLSTTNPVLDYANAMVSGGPTNWQEHIDGKSNYAPPIPPLAPCKFTGGLDLSGSSANCNNFASSQQNADANYVMTIMPNGAGVTCGMLGFMFWATEYPSTRGTGTVPPNTCENGMGAAAKAFNIPIPMPPLRQQ